MGRVSRVDEGMAWRELGCGRFWLSPVDRVAERRAWKGSGQGRIWLGRVSWFAEQVAWRGWDSTPADDSPNRGHAMS